MQEPDKVSLNPGENSELTFTGKIGLKSTLITNKKSRVHSYTESVDVDGEERGNVIKSVHRVDYEGLP
ncbi:hypothetical protein QJS04_geneDACA016340 [Acorus gramineus]|uniref:Uncharacterized protein n=1 Tax=Acorus gramineus TaxID=55184 RepID=A0AAV9APH6_ACOGR|nr:hypothetical protein QJS04_geneDACA016340 [Acorus gramineus]